MNTIAERIKFAMKAKNKKQVDIVKDTGISKGAFSSYLSGQYNPKADKLELIADSLDVDLRWLYGENVPMENAQKDDTALQYVFYANYAQTECQFRYCGTAIPFLTVRSTAR